MSLCIYQGKELTKSLVFDRCILFLAASAVLATPLITLSQLGKFSGGVKTLLFISSLSSVAVPLFLIVMKESASCTAEESRKAFRHIKAGAIALGLCALLSSHLLASQTFSSLQAPLRKLYLLPLGTLFLLGGRHIVKKTTATKNFQKTLQAILALAIFFAFAMSAYSYIPVFHSLSTSSKSLILGTSALALFQLGMQPLHKKSSKKRKTFFVITTFITLVASACFLQLSAYKVPQTQSLLSLCIWAPPFLFLVYKLIPPLIQKISNNEEEYY